MKVRVPILPVRGVQCVRMPVLHAVCCVLCVRAGSLVS